MSNIAFDLTTEEGRQLFYKYCNQFDYEIYKEQIKIIKHKKKISRRKKVIYRKVLNHPDFIRASELHINKFDFDSFNRLWDEISHIEGFECSISLI